ncbi:MAG: alpha/beta hydrolase [Myxococcota bacterium]
MLLCHGFLDHGRTWDFVVDALAGSDLHLVAFDWRGHGQTAWVGEGGTYHFADYLLDLADIVDAVARDRLHLCGHSMGGGVAAHYAGAFPARVASLALLEGLGPPAGSFDEAPERHVAFVTGARRERGRSRRPIATIDDAVRRVREAHPGIGEDAARHLARNGTRPHEGGHGLDWRYDPMHRVTFPHPFYVAHAQAFWRRIRCPVLLVEGDASPFAKLPDLDARRQALPHATRAAITGAGHMMHVEAPHEVAAALVALWRGC